MPDDFLEMIDADETGSVDDFIRELEAKEKDLMISPDMQIEIQDSEEADGDVPDYITQDLEASSPLMPGIAVTQATKARNYALENELSALKVRVLELKSERHEIQEKSDRRLKDFENFKYRMDRERRGAFIDQIANLASQMLPVLDNLDRALVSADHIEGARSPEFQQFFDGIVLVNQQVNDVFAHMGVQPIATVGELFDPNFHEAVATEIRDDIPHNTVSQEMLRGYRIGNKVVRHSMVRVAVVPPPPPTAEPANAEPPAPLESTDLNTTETENED